MAGRGSVRPAREAKIPVVDRLRGGRRAGQHHRGEVDLHVEMQERRTSCIRRRRGASPCRRTAAERRRSTASASRAVANIWRPTPAPGRKGELFSHALPRAHRPADATPGVVNFTSPSANGRTTSCFSEDVADRPSYGIQGRPAAAAGIGHRAGARIPRRSNTTSWRGGRPRSARHADRPGRQRPRAGSSRCGVWPAPEQVDVDRLTPLEAAALVAEKGFQSGRYTFLTVGRAGGARAPRDRTSLASPCRAGRQPRSAHRPRRRVGNIR